MSETYRVEGLLHCPRCSQRSIPTKLTAWTVAEANIEWQDNGLGYVVRATCAQCQYEFNRPVIRKQISIEVI